jgi:hypothetical protein
MGIIDPVDDKLTFNVATAPDVQLNEVDMLAGNWSPQEMISSP